ncbi:hypothetical protein GYH30_009707 [Glycine max]|nr:hypothetical protein GYH30_009707 [Glycine max]
MFYCVTGKAFQGFKAYNSSSTVFLKSWCMALFSSLTL